MTPDELKSVRRQLADLMLDMGRFEARVNRIEEGDPMDPTLKLIVEHRIGIGWMPVGRCQANVGMNHRTFFSQNRDTIEEAVADCMEKIEGC